MKKIIIAVLLILNINAVFSQQRTDTRSDRIIANQGIFLKDRWIDSLLVDTSFNGQTRALPTADAVYKFVTGRIAGISGGGSITGGEASLTATSGQTNFLSPYALPADAAKITVSRNGVIIPFTKSVNTVTIIACDAGDIVKIKWID